MNLKKISTALKKMVVLPMASAVTAFERAFAGTARCFKRNGIRLMLITMSRLKIPELSAETLREYQGQPTDGARQNPY